MEKNQNGGIIKFVTGFDAVSFHISRIACVVCGVMLVFVTLMICAGVINRLFFTSYGYLLKSGADYFWFPCHIWHSGSL